jgi:hypothetical protein
MPEDDWPRPSGIVIFRVGTEYWRIDHSRFEPRAEFLDPSGAWRPSVASPLLFSQSMAVEVIDPDDARLLGLPD